MGQKTPIVIVLAAIILLAGCKSSGIVSGESEAEMSWAAQFVEETSLEELTKIVEMAGYLLIGETVSFTRAEEIPALNILNMYCAAENNGEISVEALTAFSDKYFGAGVFTVEELLEADNVPITIDAGTIDAKGFGNVPGYFSGDVQIEAVKAKDQQVIIDVAIALNGNKQDKILGQLVLSVDDKGHHYKAYQFSVRPFASADCIFPPSKVLPLAEIDRYFGEPTAKETFIWEAETFGQTRQYGDDTEATIYLDEATSDSGVVIGIATKRPQLALVQDIQIGDTLEQVTAHFLIGDYPLETLDGSEASTVIRRLYGEIKHMGQFGYIEYQGEQPIAVHYEQEGCHAVFYLDEQQQVVKMALSCE